MIISSRPVSFNQSTNFNIVEVIFSLLSLMSMQYGSLGYADS
jgi:hypothetical protein